MTTTYFIPIKSMNLAHYLSSGIIAPANYIENRNQDLQNRFINNILLSSSKFTVDTNCSLEIVLNDEEEVPEKISDNFFVVDMPLPISRIKTIYFIDVEQKTSTVFNITNGAAFIPNKILLISDDKPINTSEIDNVSTKPTEVDWKHYLKKYDQLLGGFALMKIGKEDFQNYPTHYFKSLGNINKYFNQILIEQNIELENVFEFAFIANGPLKPFHDTIYSEITSEIVSRYAREDNIKIETRNGLILIDKIPESKKTYYVSILNSYGQGKRKQADSFISDLVSGNFDKKRKEGLSLIFGINKGYSSFRNKYKTENFEASIKFKLDSKLDYYIIESVYQNVFKNQVISNSFSFIDDWFDSSVEQEINTSKFITYKVLDKAIILKKKENFFIELFHRSSEKRNTLLEIISKNISKSLPKFLPLDTILFKELLVDEFEQFFKDYSQFIVSETQKKVTFANELETNSLKKKIADLTIQIENQQNEIESLLEEKDKHNLAAISQSSSNEKQKNESVNQETIKIKEDVQSISQTEENLKVEDKNKLEASIKKQTESELSDRNEEINQKENIVNELKENYNQNFSRTLFSDEDLEVKKKYREKELKSLTVPDLKSIAIDLKIKLSSKVKKDIIADILKKEFYNGVN